jgi:hypothetical protein
MVNFRFIKPISFAILALIVVGARNAIASKTVCAPLTLIPMGGGHGVFLPGREMP